MKNYIGISRDHSGSMSSIARAAARDYNGTIDGIRKAAATENIDTIVSVVKCGVGSRATVDRESVNSSITVLQPLNENQYKTDGSGTPLFDSVGELITMLESAPDAKDPDVTFLVMAITDGEENASRRWSGRSLAEKIKQLQATDRWTFVFRVPRGYTRNLTAYGIPEGNILEWEQTTHGMEKSTTITTQAFTNFYSGLKSGVRSTTKFYTNLKDVDDKTIKASLRNISNEVSIWTVGNRDGAVIRDFVESQLGGGQKLLKGAAFYQLMKTESEVQDYKQIAIRDKTNGAIYSGDAARDLLSLPRTGTVAVAPGDHGKYDIFIQSTSVNRKLPSGTQVLYWPNVGKPYQEGVSATPAPVAPTKPVAKPIVVRSASPQVVIEAYKLGYKHGRGKQANLVKNGKFTGDRSEQAAYTNGFADGKAKKPLAA